MSHKPPDRRPSQARWVSGLEALALESTPLPLSLFISKSFLVTTQAAFQPNAAPVSREGCPCAASPELAPRLSLEIPRGFKHTRNGRRPEDAAANSRWACHGPFNSFRWNILEPNPAWNQRDGPRVMLKSLAELLLLLGTRC